MFFYSRQYQKNINDVYFIMSNSILAGIDLNNIAWNADDTSDILTSIGIIQVYKIKSAIRTKLIGYCNMAMRNIWKLKHNDNSFFTTEVLCPLTLTVPELDNNVSCKSIYSDLQKIIISFMENKLVDVEVLQVYDASISDNDFMMLLGSQCDYHGECMVCQTINVTDAIICRPCGHSVCIDKCISKLCNCQMTAEMFPYVSSKLKCPTCEESITKLFRANDIVIPDSWIKEINDIASFYCADKFSIHDGKYVYIM